MRRRWVTAIGILVATTALAGAAGATTDAAGSRLAGTNRIETSQAVARATFDQANVALLVNGFNFPDALAATYLAGVSGAPILLTEPDRLSDGVLELLGELGVEGVFVIGGEAAVSSDVVNALSGAGFVVDRVAGVNRYSTARLVAELAGPDPVGEFGAGKAAIVVTGEDFADALAAGPVAAAQGLPILLTGRDSLHPDAESGLLSLGIEQVLVIGGQGAVSTAAAARIFSLGIEVRRVAGATRHETAARLADLTLAELQFPGTGVILARGDSYADALIGGIRGGLEAVPILLIESASSLGPVASSWIAENKGTISSVEALGGEGAVGQAVLDAAVTVARQP